jgi:hypothetical protein
MAPVLGSRDCSHDGGVETAPGVFLQWCQVHAVTDTVVEVEARGGDKQPVPGFAILNLVKGIVNRFAQHQ